MPIKRGPDGRILNDAGDTDYDAPTTTGGAIKSTPGGASLSDDYDTPTVTGPTVQTTSQITGQKKPSSAAPDDDDEFNPRTKVVGRQNKTSGAAPAHNDPMADPVVGWLVSIAGPGKGTVLQMGYGRNTVGRGADVRLRADFGDDEISRTAHCVVTYDPRTRKYFLQGGDGANLTYLDDNPVLQPIEIAAGAQIQIGSTTLRFLPFCDAGFEWQDISE